MAGPPAPCGPGPTGERHLPNAAAPLAETARPPGIRTIPLAVRRLPLRHRRRPPPRPRGLLQLRRSAAPYEAGQPGRRPDRCLMPPTPPSTDIKHHQELNAIFGSDPETMRRQRQERYGPQEKPATPPPATQPGAGINRYNSRQTGPQPAAPALMKPAGGRATAMFLSEYTAEVYGPPATPTSKGSPVPAPRATTG